MHRHSQVSRKSVVETASKCSFLKPEITLHPHLQHLPSYYWDLSDNQRQKYEPFGGQFDPLHVIDGQGHQLKTQVKFHNVKPKVQPNFLQQIRKEKYNKRQKSNASMRSDKTQTSKPEFRELNLLRIDASLSKPENNRIRRQVINQLKQRENVKSRERQEALHSILKMLNRKGASISKLAKTDPLGFALQTRCNWQFFRLIHTYNISSDEIIDQLFQQTSP